MAVQTILLHITICLLLLINRTFSISGCADVDIHFLIDIDSIINNGEYIQELIASIVWDGSSEYSAFSVVLYGNNIPNSITAVKIMQLDDNVNITQRNAEEDRIIDQLNQVFEAIFEHENEADTYTISLREAFSIADDQHKPQRAHKKRDEILNNYNVGILDDENVYFIFDYQNMLLSDGANNDLCFLLNHNEENNDETVHFVFGQSYDNTQSDINCNDAHQIYNNTFFYFNDLLTDIAKKEQLLDITCPAYIIAPEYGGFLNLGNHVQWIDINTFIGCNLDEINKHNSELPAQLNSETSYILVKDYINDGNTFKTNDYLLSFPEIQSNLGEIGCEFSVYKINSIEMIDSYTYDNYDIIKLFVSLPESPMEYINDASVSAHKNNRTNSGRNGRRRMGYWEDFGRSWDAAWKTVGDVFDSITKGYIWTDDISVPVFNPNLVFGNSWEHSKVGKVTQSFGEQPKFTFTGEASMDLKAGYKFDASMKLYFEFYWHILKEQVSIFVSVEPTIKIDVSFSAEFTGSATVDIKNILNWSKYMTIGIGPVPVVVKPFIIFNAKLVTVPIRVKAGITCHYEEEVEVGYHYQNYYDAEDNSYPASTKIYNRYTDSSQNGCTKTLELGSEEENEEKCPAMALGFDVETELKIGANIYSMITAYGKLTLELPFRITVPQMDNAICPSADTSCNNNNYLQASFTVGPMELSINAGIAFQLAILEDVLKIMAKIVGTGDDYSISYNVGEFLLGKWQILPLQNLGCTPLNGPFYPLNIYYKSKCCASFQTSFLHTGYAYNGEYKLSNRYNSHNVYKHSVYDVYFYYSKNGYWKQAAGEPLAELGQFYTCSRDNEFECEFFDLCTDYGVFTGTGGTWNERPIYKMDGYRLWFMNPSWVIGPTDRSVFYPGMPISGCATKEVGSCNQVRYCAGTADK